MEHKLNSIFAAASAVMLDEASKKTMRLYDEWDCETVSKKQLANPKIKAAVDSFMKTAKLDNPNFVAWVDSGQYDSDDVVTDLTQAAAKFQRFNKLSGNLDVVLFSIK